ncbi:hypothetical protein KAU55_07495 [Candidatus Bathyarchaeota archaeon]|nr:hypothetical protein [Candidatus Bathyarchaeota archaeon]
MKINHKKILKFVTLLITALLIATVSAQVYRYMYIDGSITVGGAKMIWILGDNAPAGASISGSTVTMDLDVEQGTPLNFTEALFLNNNNATGSFNYNLNVTTVVLSSDFQRAKMHIYENYTASPSWTYVDTLDLTSDTDYYSGSLAAGNYLRMTFEVNATQSSGTYNFDFEVKYWAP